MVFSRVPPLLCAFGSCTLNRTSWTTWDHLQETRQFAVGCPSPEVYPVLCRFGMRHRGLGSVYFIVQHGDVRFLRSHRSDRYPRDSPAFTSLLRLSRLSVSLFDYTVKCESKGKSLVKGPRFVESRGAIARAQAKRIGENSIKSWCM